MELPASWGLRTEKREDGKLDIVGKTDAGADYRVRTTDGPEVTSVDLAELHDADRESYSSRESGVRTFLDKLNRHGRKLQQDRESVFHDELTESASELIRNCTEGGMDTRLGLISMPATFGSTRLLRANWPKDWD